MLLGLAGISALRDPGASARQVGLAAVLPSTVATLVLAALAGVGLALVAFVVVRATRRVAAGFVSALLTLSAVGLLVAWADGQPARCLCLSGATHQSGLAHLSTFVAVATLAGVSWGAMVARRRSSN